MVWLACWFAVGNARIIEAINLCKSFIYQSVPRCSRAAAIALSSGPQECVDELVDFTKVEEMLHLRM